MSKHSSKSDSEPDPQWSRRNQEIGVVAWSSFLAASFATMLFFAHFDPTIFALDNRSWLHFDSAMTGYAVGFFFFWAVTAISASLATFLLRPKSDPGDRHGKRDRS